MSCFPLGMARTTCGAAKAAMFKGSVRTAEYLAQNEQAVFGLISRHQNQVILRSSTSASEISKASGPNRNKTATEEYAFRYNPAKRQAFLTNAPSP
jgi:hypothetical protein